MTHDHPHNGTKCFTPTLCALRKAHSEIAAFFEEKYPDNEEARQLLQTIGTDLDAQATIPHPIKKEPAYAYGYGDRVTWEGKPALIIHGSEDATYIINVFDPRATYSHSNYSHISGEELSPGWPA